MITLFWLCKIFITLPLILPGKNTKSPLKEEPQRKENKYLTKLHGQQLNRNIQKRMIGG